MRVLDRAAAPIAVASLVAANLAVFGFEASQGEESRRAFVDAFAVVPYDVTHGVQIAAGPPTLATLGTASFLHASASHLVLNMLFLGAFGPAIERLAGAGRFVALYLACGLLGNLAVVSAAPQSHVPEIGASGAIAGVLGAYVMRFPTVRLGGRIPAFVVICLWAAVQFVHGFGTLAANAASERGGGTAYFAHIGGFLAGVFAVAFERRRIGEV